MNLFDLYARISIDTEDYERGLAEASGKTSSFASKIGRGLASAAKVGATAISAAATGIAALTKTSVDGYAEYEQLVGGVDTLFKYSSKKVQEYAENAYKTAGMSANEYMSTVTSFSASLLQSLGGDTEKAAEKADQAITDMADNANKMGTSIDMIQNAYQGFAKQNFTMLDNLKLGYGGTKEEMARLLEDAEKLSGQKFDLSSYADIVDAIHVVQTEMGITGTTAREAASTIEGSLASMASAWKNLVAGLGNENADLDQLISNFVESASTAAGNIIPRITRILSGMGTAIQQIAPILAAEIPALISSTLPALVSAGAQLLIGLITGLISALPELAAAVPQIVTEVYNSFVAAGPQLITAGSELLNMLGNGILEAVPALLKALPDVITGIIDFLTENGPAFVETGMDFIINLVDGIIGAIPDMVAKLPQVITAYIDYVTSMFPTILKKGAELLGKMVSGIIGAIPDLVAALPKIINAIIDGIDNLMDGIVDIGKNIVKGIWNGIKEMADWLKDKVTGFFSGIVDGVKGILGIHSPSRVFADMGKNMALGIEEGWGSQYERIKHDIEGGMNFETATVDFSSSGLARASRTVSGGVMGAVSTGQQSREIVIPITLSLDGSVLARKMYKYNKDEEFLRGSFV